MPHAVLVLALALGGASALAPATADEAVPPFVGHATTVQTKAQFLARLSTVPIDVAMQAAIAGQGRATATLNGRTLTIEGEFRGLKTPATIARIHIGPKGIRGPAVFDLTVSKATSGSIGGTVELTPQQIDDLNQSRFYIQLHSDKAPDGNLWGWLLPQEGRR
jgi:hypothetical protein